MEGFEDFGPPDVPENRRVVLWNLVVSSRSYLKIIFSDIFGSGLMPTSSSMRLSLCIVRLFRRKVACIGFWSVSGCSQPQGLSKLRVGTLISQCEMKRLERPFVADFALMAELIGHGPPEIIRGMG